MSNCLFKYIFLLSGLLISCAPASSHTRKSSSIKHLIRRLAASRERDWHDRDLSRSYSRLPRCAVCLHRVSLCGHNVEWKAHKNKKNTERDCGDVRDECLIKKNSWLLALSSGPGRKSSGRSGSPFVDGLRIDSHTHTTGEMCPAR